MDFHIESDILILQPTQIDNLEFVIKSEKDPANSPYIINWSLEEHKSALNNPDMLHLVVADKREKRLIGFAILAGLQNPHHSIELKRIVINDKGKGYGRKALRLIKLLAFNRLGAHRLWLDVFSYNSRARHVYESEGFVVEGALRECINFGGQYQSLLIMSLLENEFQALVEKN